MKVFLLHDDGDSDNGGWYYKGGDDNKIDFTGDVDRACFWVSQDTAQTTCTFLNRKRHNKYKVIEKHLK